MERELLSDGLHHGEAMPSQRTEPTLSGLWRRIRLFATRDSSSQSGSDGTDVRETAAQAGLPTQKIGAPTDPPASIVPASMEKVVVTSTRQARVDKERTAALPAERESETGMSATHANAPLGQKRRAPKNESPVGLSLHLRSQGNENQQSENTRSSRPASHEAPWRQQGLLRTGLSVRLPVTSKDTSSKEETTVHVSIGRIEIRATPPRRENPVKQGMTLHDYLQRRATKASDG